jgi:UDP-glucose 4-epimerase
MGAAGFIGSHTAVEMLKSGYDVVIVDNLVNSRREAVRRIAEIAGRSVASYETNVRDTVTLERIDSRDDENGFQFLSRIDTRHH